MENQDPTAQPEPTPEQTIAVLTSQITELEKKLADERQTGGIREAVSTSSQQPARVPSTGSEMVSRQTAIAAVGGLAKWTMLPIDVRLKALGQRPATISDVEDAKRIFGRGSSSAIEASRLARHNPQRYSFLRIVHREL